MSKALNGPIVFVGADSVYGLEDSELGGYVQNFKASLKNQEEFKSEVYSLGIVENTSSDILKRIEEIVVRKPKMIIYHLDAFECMRKGFKENPPDIYEDLFKDNIEKIIKKTKKKSTTIAFIDFYPLDVSKTTPFKNSNRYFLLYELIRYSDVLKIVCKQNRVSVLNIMDEWLKIDYKKYLDEDGLHLNSNGHEFIFNQLKNFFEIDYNQ